MAAALPRSLPPPRRLFEPPRTTPHYLAQAYQQLLPTPSRRLPSAAGHWRATRLRPQAAGA